MATKVSLHDVFEISNRIEEKLDKLEVRISTLEIWKAEIMGKIAVLGGVIVLGANLFIDWLKERVFGKT